LGKQGYGSVSTYRGKLHKNGGGLFAILLGTYILVMLALGLGSVSGVWAFPALWPQTLTGGAWASVAGSFSTVIVTFSLGLASSLTALVWAVAWLETAPPTWDARLRQFIYLPLVLPSVLWVVGIHAVCLTWGLDGHWSGLWLAHTLAVLPYVVIALSPAFLGFDVRYRHVSASIGKTSFSFLWRVKWPLLRAALVSAVAVGFAVSVAQYLPTLYVGAGRYATVTTEAVNLAAGAQRSLTSAYAMLQWLLPVIGFSIAAWAGQARRFKSAESPQSKSTNRP
jgi:putative thiamine transport system permease protein